MIVREGSPESNSSLLNYYGILLLTTNRLSVLRGTNSICIYLLTYHLHAT